MTCTFVAVYEFVMKSVKILQLPQSTLSGMNLCSSRHSASACCDSWRLSSMAVCRSSLAEPENNSNYINKHHGIITAILINSSLKMWWHENPFQPTILCIGGVPLIVGFSGFFGHVFLLRGLAGQKPNGMGHVSLTSLDKEFSHN